MSSERIKNISKETKDRLSYIRSFFCSKPFKWLNCVELDNVSLRDYEQANRHLTLKFYVLGLSISRALSIAKDNNKTLLLIIAQIFEEFEYYFSSQAIRVGRVMIARSTESHVPRTDFPEIFPSLIRFGNNVVYHALVLPQLSFDVSNARVTKSLLGACEKVFARVENDNHDEDEEEEDNSRIDLVTRIENKVMHWVLGPIIKGLNDQATSELKLELTAFKRST